MEIIDTTNSMFKGDFEVADPLAATTELAHILLNLRQHTKRYDQQFGITCRRRKQYWEEKADKWLTDHRIDKTVTNQSQ
jgi:hypothetical protein